MASKAVQHAKFDAEDAFATLTVADKQKPTPKDNEVLIRMLVRPVNPADVFAVKGYYPGFQPSSFPATPGLEGAGVVEAVGSGVSALQAGQRVVPFLGLSALANGGGEGSFQDYLVVPAEECVPVPEGVSDEVAAQLVVNPFTVYGLLEAIDAPKGEWVIQSAANSVLGRMLIQLAKDRGHKTINLIRKEEQREGLKALGADVVLNYESEDVVAKVKELTGGKGAWGAVDPILGPIPQLLVNSVRNGGRVYVYSSMAGFDVKAPVLDFIFRNVSVHGFWVNLYVQELAAAGKLRQVANEILDLFQRGILQPNIAESYPLEKYEEALKKTEAGQNLGKILLVSGK